MILDMLESVRETGEHAIKTLKTIICLDGDYLSTEIGDIERRLTEIGRKIKFFSY